MNSTAQQSRDPKLPTGPPLKTALKIVSRSTETRASNEAPGVARRRQRDAYRLSRRALHGGPCALSPRQPTSDGTWSRGNSSPTGRRRRLQRRWAVASGRYGAAFGPCAKRARSKSDGGYARVRRRMCGFCPSGLFRPSGWCMRPVEVRSDGAGVRSESACVRSGVRSGVLSGVRSHTEPRTEPQKNHVGSSRAREEETRWYCSCGNDWPKRCGSTCYPCGKDADAKPPKPADEPKACSCGTAYRQSYGRLCLDCNGVPSPAQRDALREKHGCRGEDDRVGGRWGGSPASGAGDDAPPLEAIASTPPRAETETRQPPETRGQRPDSSVSPEHGSPPNGGEPGPNARRFFADFAKWTVGKRTPTQHGSDRRRLTRTARKELADLAKGDA